MLSTLFTNDVRQTLDQFRRSVDQMFENFYEQPMPNPPSHSGERAWAFSPLVESSWSNDALNLRAILPGVSEGDLRVSVQHNQLLIEGERKAPEGFQKNAFTQLAYGRFYTVVTLPAGLDTDHVNCRLHQGVLDLQIPIQEASKPKQIQIQSGEDRKAIR